MYIALFVVLDLIILVMSSVREQLVKFLSMKFNYKCYFNTFHLLCINHLIIHK